MLDILNNLGAFLKIVTEESVSENTRQNHEYLPPTASKILTEYSKEGILIKEAERNYLFFPCE